MGYWDGKSAALDNIRHYSRCEGWRASEDKKNDKGKSLSAEARGPSKRH
ncbi:hypothetical protein [Mesorhizobium onobrychidis]|nr:hypothetical protein [Mesorhizobium onobrychidis]